MKKHKLTLPLLIGLIFFVLSIFLFIFLESPQPFFAALFVAFIMAETTFLYRLNKNKERSKEKLRQY
ncbi:hypothetical protein ACERII_06355 [Evansella sp. AB-rgal1]|uniref:hypothetical protein n=1 Tax=Evansella sp. AB-rgal1 TaxID=3242696 RepID=UPI00359D12DF